MVKKILAGMLISSSVFGQISIVKKEMGLTVPVIDVVPVMEMVKVDDIPIRVCVPKKIVVQDTPFRWLGGSIGALTGHFISRAVTSSDVTRILSTVAGTMVGSSIEKELDDSTKIVNDCTIKHNSHYDRIVTGYNVFYEIDGTRHSIFMNHDPGHKIRIKKWVEHSVIK
jgi:uncharacterized protein YcfJ